MSAKDWATKRSARYDIRSYVCYAPQARSRGPGPHAVPVIPWPMKKRASLSKRVFWPKPLKTSLRSLWPKTGKTSKEQVTADGTRSDAACKGEIVAPWPFESGFSDRLPGGIRVRV
jgi:hypothetical protein